MAKKHIWTLPYNGSEGFLHAEASDVSGYKQWKNALPDGASPTEEYASMGATGEIQVGSSFITAPLGEPVTLENPTFTMQIWSYLTGGTAYLRAKVYRYRDGVETLLFTTSDSDAVPTSYQKLVWAYPYSGTIDLLATDRLVVKIFANRTVKATGKRIYIAYDHSTRDSRVFDPETRYLRYALWDNKTYPSSYNLISGSLAGGSLANLQASDDVYMYFNSALVGSDQIVEVEFIGSLTGHVPFLQVAIEHHESATTVDVVISVYNYQTGAYETVGTMYLNTGGSTTDVTNYLYHLLGNKGVYVSATGEWKVKVKAKSATSPPSAFTIYFDYLHFRSVCFQLGTTQTTTAGGNDLYVDGLNVGIRVWGIKADETEEEITAGATVANVTGPSATTTLSATWNCPTTVQNVAFFIIVYRDAEPMKTADYATGGLPLVFMTEDLNAQLQSATWTVYYAFYYNAAYDETYFRFGASTYNSRVENFTWAVPVVGQYYVIGDGLVCSVIFT